MSVQLLRSLIKSDTHKTHLFRFENCDKISCINQTAFAFENSVEHYLTSQPLPLQQQFIFTIFFFFFLKLCTYRNFLHIFHHTCLYFVIECKFKKQNHLFAENLHAILSLPWEYHYNPFFICLQHLKLMKSFTVYTKQKKKRFHCYKLFTFFFVFPLFS